MFPFVLTIFNYEPVNIKLQEIHTPVLSQDASKNKPLLCCAFLHNPQSATSVIMEYKN